MEEERARMCQNGRMLCGPTCAKWDGGRCADVTAAKALREIAGLLEAIDRKLNGMMRAGVGL